MRRLGGAMDNQVEALLFEQVEHLQSIADVEITMDKALGAFPKMLEVPAGVTLWAEELTAEIIIDSNHVMAFPVVIGDGLRANQSTRSGDQNFHGVKR